MKKKKILLVEDEAVTAHWIKMELINLGYQVITAGSGNKALEEVALTKPDFIVMDIHLVGSIDGIETMKQIKQRDNIPFIFMTGFQQEILKEIKQQLNPLSILIKPIDIIDIQHFIEQV